MHYINFVQFLFKKYYLKLIMSFIYKLNNVIFESLNFKIRKRVIIKIHYVLYIYYIYAGAILDTQCSLSFGFQAMKEKAPVYFNGLMSDVSELLLFHTLFVTTQTDIMNCK